MKIEFSETIAVVEAHDWAKQFFSKEKTVNAKHNDKSIIKISSLDFFFIILLYYFLVYFTNKCNKKNKKPI